MIRDEVSELTLAWIERVEEELPLPICLFPCILAFAVSSPVEQASVVGFFAHFEWCFCSHELKCVAKTKEQKEEVVIECSSRDGAVHGVALPFTPQFSCSRELRCVAKTKEQKEEVVIECSSREMGQFTE